LGGSDTPLEGFVDADHAGDLDSRKSTRGFVFKVYGGAVTWGGREATVYHHIQLKQSLLLASQAVKEAIWLRGLLGRAGYSSW